MRVLCMSSPLYNLVCIRHRTAPATVFTHSTRNEHVSAFVLSPGRSWRILHQSFAQLPTVFGCPPASHAGGHGMHVCIGSPPAPWCRLLPWAPVSLVMAASSPGRALQRYALHPMTVKAAMTAVRCSKHFSQRVRTFVRRAANTGVKGATGPGRPRKTCARFEFPRFCEVEVAC